MSSATISCDAQIEAAPPVPGEAQIAPGTLADIIAGIQRAVRQKPGDDTLRVHLFQRYAQAGQWDKALAQLQMAAKLNSDHTMLAHAYRLVLRAELLREEVFCGIRTPQVLGRPLQWVGHLVDALQADGQGEYARAADLRAQALEDARPIPGRIDGQAFAWIADADPRIGPVLEAQVNGGYYWVPFEHIAHITLETPVDLCDLVWIPARLTLRDEGVHAALLPARYPLPGTQVEDAHLQSRLTSWQQTGADAWQGVGVKVLATNTDETSILDARDIQLAA